MGWWLKKRRKEIYLSEKFHKGEKGRAGDGPLLQKCREGEKGNGIFLHIQIITQQIKLAHKIKGPPKTMVVCIFMICSSFEYLVKLTRDLVIE